MGSMVIPGSRGALHSRPGTGRMERRFAPVPAVPILPGAVRSRESRHFAPPGARLDTEACSRHQWGRTESSQAAARVRGGSAVMARKSWSFVDSQVRPGDILCFVVVWAYLLVVLGYLVATRQIALGIRWRGVARTLL